MTRLRRVTLWDTIDVGFVFAPAHNHAINRQAIAEGLGARVVLIQDRVMIWVLSQKRGQKARLQRWPRASNVQPWRRLGFEILETRALLTVDLISGVTDQVLIGATGNGDSRNSKFALSSDGRYVVLHSVAGNLVPDDRNGRHDVFIQDRL